jgi:hypothetical protein
VSVSFNPVPVASAFMAAAEDFVGAHELVVATTEQKEFVELFGPYLQAVSLYKASTSGFAAQMAEPLNDLLERRGFEIRLESWQKAPRRFGIAGVTDATVSWHTPARVVVIEPRSGGEYPGFAVNEAQMGRVIIIDGFRQPMVQMQTKEGLEVRITMTGEPGSQLEMVRQSMRLHEAEASAARIVEFDGAHLPMVHMLRKPDVNWLSGLAMQALEGGLPWVLVQAVMENRLAMNQFGARVKDAFAGGFERMAIGPKEPYIVDRPFLMVISKQGRPGQPGDAGPAPAPMMGAYITPEDWKNPGDLSSL